MVSREREWESAGPWVFDSGLATGVRVSAAVAAVTMTMKTRWILLISLLPLPLPLTLVSAAVPVPFDVGHVAWLGILLDVALR